MCKRRIGAAIAAMVVLGTCSSAAQTILQKADRDETLSVARGDPHMAAAVRKARATLPQFLVLARSPRPTITSMAVKVGVRDGDGAEFFWITKFREEAGRFRGRISNTPRSVKNVKQWDTIEFAEDDIVDWLYREAGRMHGNFTACALLKHQPKREAEALMKSLGLSCDP